MKLVNHRVFFHEEFFGARIYNTKSQEEYFFDKNSIVIIKKIFSGDYKNNSIINETKADLIKKGLLTSDVVHIENKNGDGLSAPLRVSLNVTRKCNLRCKHCFSDSGISDPNELTTQELFGLIDQMKGAGTFFLAIGGGEPLLRDDLFEIIKYARENFIAVSIITNGLLINEETAKKLYELNLKTITISIDGLEKNHDKLRGKGNFKKTINNIKILRKYCPTTKLAIRVTLNTLNINEYRELIKLAEGLSLDLIRFTPILLLGRTRNHQDLLVNQKEYIHFLKNIQNVKSKITLEFPGKKDERKWFTPSKEFGCHCGKEVCWITQTGDFYPCIFFGNSFIAGNIRNESFLSLWTKSKNMVKLCGNEICNNCPIFLKCRGGCRARALSKYKDINAVDPLCPLERNKLKFIKI